MIGFKTFLIRLNEGLITTTEIDKTLSILDRHMTDMGTFQVKKESNKFSITFHDLKNIFGFDYILTIINNLGWYPSSYKLWKKEMVNIFTWNNLKDFENEIKTCDKILIYFESTFSTEVKKPDISYHVFCYLNLKKIKKIGIVPKSLNKITSHPDRIYLVNNIPQSIKIGKMIKNQNLFNNYKKYKDINYGVLKIDMDKFDTKCFNDDNYKGGFYILNNIPKENIEILDIII